MSGISSNTCPSLAGPATNAKGSEGDRFRAVTVAALPPAQWFDLAVAVPPQIDAASVRRCWLGNTKDMGEVEEDRKGGRVGGAAPWLVGIGRGSIQGATATVGSNGTGEPEHRRCPAVCSASGLDKWSRQLFCVEWLYVHQRVVFFLDLLTQLVNWFPIAGDGSHVECHATFFFAGNATPLFFCG